MPGMQPPLPPQVVRELVCSCLHRDPVAADLRCSLFIAAAQNYKKDSLLRPFPPRYIHKDSKDFDALLADVNSFPGVRELVRLRPGEGEHHMALAHWILSSKSFAVKTLQKDEYAKLCTLTQSDGVSAPAPDFLFELEYCDQLNARFERMREDRDVFYAFHGSRLENFHSIIHNGLHCHLNKNSVFGEGTYLTSDLSLAVLYSPHSSGWQESLLGPMLSCIALCEVIDHPDVKCQTLKLSTVSARGPKTAKEGTCRKSTLWSQTISFYVSSTCWFTLRGDTRPDVLATPHGSSDTTLLS
ncbi:protein mono-ADP-ribosyltransferase PARP16 isoform X3 [Hippocampus comes]|uniref:protein mono-ADP-ribosyltransferase PARP16 isoform X3 n=1 Tax=Hippocampus comes TaxID=109280 RepID=UPI00094EF98D|nr:PREDICTED: mono [ADP-ribose] polymerase PARP16 isoform X3 [Hippocampus comes]